MKRAKITLNIQHDYITLKLPVGNFTTSYGGAKASGQLASIKGAFETLDKYVQEHIKKRTPGVVMNELTNPELMDKLVPGWDKPKEVVIIGGETVKFTNPLYVKRYSGEYKVAHAKPKYAFLEVPRKGGGTETIGFAKFELEIVK